MMTLAEAQTQFHAVGSSLIRHQTWMIKVSPVRTPRCGYSHKIAEKGDYK